MRVVALASGQGTNLSAVLEATKAGRCPVSIVKVITDRKARALEVAAREGIEHVEVTFKRGQDRDAWNERLAAEIESASPDLVVSMGFMRILGKAVLRALPGRILNLHPSLLPAFPGAKATEQAIAAGVKISGCTVHVVDEGVDTGPIVAQAAVTVMRDDDAASLHARIRNAEHRLLPAVLAALATGRLSLTPLRWSEPGDESNLFSPTLP